MGGYQLQEFMLQRVADALGAELLSQVAFVGGCTTALMLTDVVSREAVRFTEDVDVIVHVLGWGDWNAMQQTLKTRGFRVSPQDDVICRMRLPGNGLGELIVDFMPDDARILGFSNRWYQGALQTAANHRLPSDAVIRVVTPVFFVATKLEAYRGRGNNDPLASRDVEDLLCVIDGREGLVDEIAQAQAEVKQYVAQTIDKLLQHPDFEYAVQSLTRNDRSREALVFQRLEAIVNLH